MQTHHYKTWGEAAGRPESAARLDTLPEGLNLSEDFPEPIQYDPKRKLLLYRGFMCSSSYQWLRSVSDDSAYLDAVTALFQASASTLNKSTKPTWTWPWKIRR